MKEIAIEELKKIDLFSSLLEEEIEVLLKKIKYKIFFNISKGKYWNRRVKSFFKR